MLLYYALNFVIVLGVAAGIIYTLNLMTLSLDEESIEEWQAFGDAIEGKK